MQKLFAKKNTLGLLVDGWEALHAYLFSEWHKPTTLDDDDVIQHEGSIAKARKLRTTHASLKARYTGKKRALDVERQGTVVWRSLLVVDAPNPVVQLVPWRPQVRSQPSLWRRRECVSARGR